MFIAPVALFAVLSIALTDAGERDRAWWDLMPAPPGMTVAALLFSAWIGVTIGTPLDLAVFELRRDVRALAGIPAACDLSILPGGDGERPGVVMRPSAVPR